MQLTAMEYAALDSTVVRLGLFVRLDTDPVLRLWAGVGPIKPGGTVRDAGGGQVYHGRGELLGVPSFSQVLNGAATRWNLSMAVLPSTAFLISVDGDAAIGAACDIGFGLFDTDWQLLLGRVHFLRRGYADTVSVNKSGAASQDANAASSFVAQLAVSSLNTGRRRPRLAYYTNADQQRRSPGDRFCERTPLYGEFDKSWPRG